jgi:DNA polymerase III delta prime subunit
MSAITTFRMLRHVVRQFKEGHVRSLMLVGPPGVGKSKTVENLFRGTDHAFVKGKCSAVEFYRELLLHQNEPVIIDDAAGLLRDHDAEEILRDLADRDVERTIRWKTQNKSFQKLSLPNQFTTTSRVCVLANSIGSGGVWNALKSRFQILTVDFQWPEVCKYAAEQEVITDQEILEYAATSALTTPSLRDLEKAVEAKQAKLFDWRQLFLHQPSVDRGAAVARLVTTPGISNNARSRTFQAEGHGSRATYYRHLRRHRAAETASSVPADQQIETAVAVLGCLTETGPRRRATRKRKTRTKASVALSRPSAKKKTRTSKNSRRGKRGPA